MKKGRWISLLLALVLACSWALLPVRAEIEVSELEKMVSGAVEDENGRAGEPADIAAIEIADLDAPRDGARFDAEATIVGQRADGAGEVSWRTPVIWTDLDGKLAENARAGQTYMPYITLFVPERYALVSDDVRAQANITLPAFFAEATGKNDTLFFLEAPESGLVFITGEVTVPGGGSPTATARGNGGSGKKTSRKKASAKSASPAPTLEPSLMVHTNDRTVETYGPNYIRKLIETVKNVVEPRAVNMLIEAFPVYGEALKNGELSSGIGFYVERQQGTIAYVKCASLVYKGSGKLAGKAMRVVVNADFFAVWDEEKGEYAFDESRRSDLEFTLTHEILHATMYDFTTNGMLGVDETGAKAPENRFPTWFSEGSATAVDNGFSYRRNQLLTLCLDLDRYNTERTAAVSFTPERMISNYQRLADRYSIDGGASGSEYAYTSGYLASMYLMQLASEHLHDDRHIAGRESYQSGDMREGFNFILGELHSGKSLDQIIAAISPTDAEGRPIYPSVAEFQSRFLGESDRDYSAAFCASFLRYLESLGKNGRHSWGCILIDFDDLRETLFTDGDAPVEPLAYRIEDTGGYVNSDVPTGDSLNTGGATIPGGGDGQAAAKDALDGEIPDIPTDFIDETPPAADPDGEDVPEQGEVSLSSDEASPDDEASEDAAPEADEEAPQTEDDAPAPEEEPGAEATSRDEDAPDAGIPSRDEDAPDAELSSRDADDSAGDNSAAVGGEARENGDAHGGEAGMERPAGGADANAAPASDASPAAQAEPTSEKTPAKAEEARNREEASSKSEASAKAETPAKEEAPAKAEGPAKAEAPAKDNAPAKSESPAKDDAPAKAESPAKVEEAPVKVEAPAKVEESPARVEAPAEEVPEEPVASE